MILGMYRTAVTSYFRGPFAAQEKIARSAGQ